MPGCHWRGSRRGACRWGRLAVVRRLSLPRVLVRAFHPVQQIASPRAAQTARTYRLAASVRTELGAAAPVSQVAGKQHQGAHPLRPRLFPCPAACWRNSVPCGCRTGSPCPAALSGDMWLPKWPASPCHRTLSPAWQFVPSGPAGKSFPWFQFLLLRNFCSLHSSSDQVRLSRISLSGSWKCTGSFGDLNHFCRLIRFPSAITPLQE